MRITVDSPVSGQDAFVFERMSVFEELGRPFRYELFLTSPSRDLSLSPMLGATIHVHVEIGPGKKRHFSGHVVSAAQLGGHGGVARYRFELRPWLYLLRHQATCRIWQKKTIVDVLQDVAKKAGFHLELGSQTLPAASREWEHLVQYRESDFNFFTRLVEQEGYHYYFRQEEKEHQLFLTDDALLHDTAFEDLKVRFQEGANPLTAEDVFFQWSVQEHLRTGIYELDDYDYKDARADLFVRSGKPTNPPAHGGKGAPARDDPEMAVYDYPGEYVVLKEGNDLATVRQQELRVDRQTSVARGNRRDLSAGSVISVEGHHREGMNGKYVVTAMQLNIEAAAVESGKGGGGDFVFNGSYALLRSEIPFRLKRTTSKPVIAGLQTGVVVGPKGEEIHTDDLGRIRVHFRWDRSVKDDGSPPEPDERSCWIRVGQPWASSGFGFQFIPRVGDEVIVQFLEGDPDRPLVTGSVYNNVNTFPYDLPAHKTQSGIKTRSSKQGGEDNANEIRFEDEKGSEELYVQAEKNHTVKVKNDRSVSVGGNETYKVTGTRDTEITKKNTDIYKDEHKMEVTKKVEEIFHDEHKWEVTKKQTITVKNNKIEHVTGAYNLTTDKKFLLTQGQTTMKFEANKVDMNIAAPLTIERGAGKVTIDDSGAITLESAMGVILKCGGSTIEITPSGVAVIGPLVTVNS